MTRNPFGDDEASVPRQKKNPFADAETPTTREESILRMEGAARRIRNLRAQIGTEGLSATGARELIDEVALAIEHAARVLKLND